MKRVMVCFFVLCAMIFEVSTVMAGDCYSDTVVKGWLEERDRAAEHVVQVWARGASPKEFASKVAVILSNEFFICAHCRNQKQFLEDHIQILNGVSQPKVKNVPGMILEYLIGHDILSPWSQFPAEKRREEVAKKW